MLKCISGDCMVFLCVEYYSSEMKCTLFFGVDFSAWNGENRRENYIAITTFFKTTEAATYIHKIILHQ
jgi:hypothetical protein